MNRQYIANIHIILYNNIAQLMVIILFTALTLAALRSPTVLSSFLVSEVTLFILLFSILTCLSRSGRTRSFSVGFCLFGWGHYVIGTLPWFSSTYGSALRDLLTAAGSKMFPDDIASYEFSDLGPKVTNFIRIGHCIFVLIF